jgi:methyltransferase
MIFTGVQLPTVIVATMVFVPMLVETAVSSIHERRLRRAGAVEPATDVYRVMALAYPGGFVAILLEGFLRAAPADAWFAAGVAVFGLAKLLKYWAMISLGRRWTFRVLVPPRSTRVVSGPYRWLSHPNYLAVAGEFAGTAIAMHAAITGPVVVAGFSYLMIRRIRVEDVALLAGEL